MLQGYMSLAMYVHYFIPGSFKIRTRLYTVKLGEIAPFIGQTQLHLDRILNRGPGPTRRTGGRWLPTSEWPYPGYCRMPATPQCLPTLCNCEALRVRWEKYLAQKEKKKFKKEK